MQSSCSIPYLGYALLVMWYVTCEEKTLRWYNANGNDKNHIALQ